MAIHGQEPLLWKGGYLAPIFKGKGDPGDVSKHRSILISSHYCKAIHKTLRNKTYHAFKSYVQQCQLGGKKRIPVTFGVHATRAFLRWQQSRGWASGLLFVDLKEAFYRVFRPLAMNIEWTDEELGQFFARLNLPSSALDDFRYHVQQQNSLQMTTMTTMQQNSIAAVHDCTWFKLRGQPDSALTTVGARPGDGFADVLAPSFRRDWRKQSS